MGLKRRYNGRNLVTKPVISHEHNNSVVTACSPCLSMIYLTQYTQQMSTLLSTTRIIVIEYLESHYKKKKLQAIIAISKMTWERCDRVVGFTTTCAISAYHHSVQYPTEIVYWSRVTLCNLYYFIPKF